MHADEAMSHEWEQLLLGKIVVGFQCRHCRATVGRYFPEWPEDRPHPKWLKAVGYDKDCTPAATAFAHDK